MILRQGQKFAMSRASAAIRLFSTTADSEFTWKKTVPNMDPTKTPSSYTAAHPFTPSTIPTKFTVNRVLPYNSVLAAKQLNRHFSSKYSDGEDDDEDSEDVESEDESDLSEEEKLKKAAEIGYTVVGQLQESDKVFKPYEPVFAVIQLGSHQFKVSNGDTIYVERLKYCDINDKLVLNQILMLGSESQTMIGRPILPDAVVHAVVEEHALDAKVIIFKKKRRKNYRRTKGHRQELTKLRITDIFGIEKPEQKPKPISPKREKPISLKTEKIGSSMLTAEA